MLKTHTLIGFAGKNLLQTNVNLFHPSITAFAAAKMEIGFIDFRFSKPYLGKELSVYYYKQLQM